MARMNLVDMAQNAIREMIASKAYDENGFLPSEGDMAKQVNVSRATIREAVRSMEVRGFVKRIHGKGVQVRDDSIGVITRSLEDMMGRDADAQHDLMEVRMLLEPGGAALAAKRRTEEDVKQLQETVAVMEQFEAMNETYHSADLRFHMLLAKATGNRIYASYMAANINALHEMIVASSKDGAMVEQDSHYHRNILDAITMEDETAARDAMWTHLKATEENLK